MTATEQPLVEKALALPAGVWTSIRDRVERVVAAEVGRQLAPVLDQQAENRSRAFTVDVLLGSGQQVDRTLHPGHYATLLRQVTDLTSSRSDVPAGASLDGAARRAFLALLDAEMRGLGRVAGSTYNILGKLVTPPILGAPDGPILEIGSLYAMFSPLLVRQFRQRGSFRSLTVVDPFAGSQLQQQANPVADHSGTPVTEQVARANLRELGVGPAELSVVNGFSTDASVRDRVSQQQFAVIVIDGDHSEQGVYADLCWVGDIAAPGALVIMDDFGDRRWPGVERAVERYLVDDGRLQMLGTVSTSAYLRMPAAEA